MLNPELKPGDHIILLTMLDEEGMLPGTKGVVIRKVKVFGYDQYEVKWENGKNVQLLSDVDVWKLDKSRMKSEKNID